MSKSRKKQGKRKAKLKRQKIAKQQAELNAKRKRRTMNDVAPAPIKETRESRKKAEDMSKEMISKIIGSTAREMPTGAKAASVFNQIANKSTRNDTKAR